MLSGARTPRRSTVLIVTAVLALAVAGCGGESGGESTAGSSSTAATTPSTGSSPGDIPTYDPDAPSATPSTTGGPCDDLAYIATQLRGEEPERVIQKGPTRVEYSGLPFVGVGCDFAYPGHEAGAAANAVTLYTYQVDHAQLTKEELGYVYDDESAVPVKGLGVPAQYVRNIDGKYTDASAEAVLGNAVVKVYVSVPDELGRESYLAKAPMVAALREFLKRA